jgi:uncharacterized membrane protein HdeD (DUF308 family)
MPPVVLFPEVNRLQRLGIALMLLGVICAFCPLIAAEAVINVVGGILLVAGSALLTHSYWGVGVSGKTATLVLGLITTLFALLILAHAWSHRSNLTLLLALYFIADGLWKILASIRFRASSGRIWLCSGALSLLLGFFIWHQWPISGLRAVGTLIGINLFSTGGTLVLLAQSLKGAIGDVLAISRGTKR